MKIHNGVLVMAVVLSGCAFASAPASQAEKEVGPSICGLAKQNLLHDGAITRVTATYKTDKSHYSYLIDSGCGKSGVLNVGNLDPVLNESVKDFYDSGDRRCAKEGTPYICVITAKVDADIKIIRGEDGKIAAELLKIHKFSFE